ncbi:nucleoside triphosphate pyrophosphohydrolase [Alloiococcus otitis]|uniref:NTP pyrophosphohydrolase MazG-like domain-containing protein n=1 Tax=Alloiococcus otitis ATCC 51267 TaxID=883081 RepID=K9EDS1_9LACT|nr:nucleotide pyrophosphohydrolase [Alloiococcus otitis]EKU94016.1 hypothetical protein HMPREF9698_00496 [Alloiococcus otitis ATCC 51267]SUU80899.1 nucleoside triphosphate pyrophosphohydrolase [Alloiococcus otitis]
MTDMADMQKQVDDFIGQFEVGYFSPLAMMARLTEETGELAREINHYHGEKQKKASEDPKSLQEELGDVLFVVISMANALEIDLDQAFQQVMAKFQDRDKDRFKRKSDQ